MVPAGSLFTVQIAGKAGSLWTPTTPGDVQSLITGELQAAGFTVVAIGLKDTDFLPGITSFNWAGTVSVRTTFDYTTTEDAQYQITQAIETATGNPATLSNPDVGDPALPAASSPWDSVFSGVQKDLGIVLAVAVGLVVLVVVIGGKDAIKAAVA